MALYKYVGESEALNPIRNYNGNSNWLLSQRNSLYGPTDQQTQVYNALGRNDGSEQQNEKNFFERKASSIGNAVGTTLSTPISIAHDIGENIATAELLGRTKSNMNDVYKQFGFQGRDDYDRQLDAAEAAGDDAEVQRLLNIPGLQSALQKQANANAAEANAKAAGYEDYRKNNLISQNINQDRGKFLGSSINTLSTAYDVASMLTGIPNGPITNAIQGGVEGIADELEQNGLENFDWGRAGQNAAIGAATGAATGAFNNALGSKNLLGKGLTNKLAKSGVGRATLGLANGTVRGAASGAVGGATGAGLSSVMNNADFGTGLQNTIQGAVRGAGSGAMVGGTMAGANMAANAAINKANNFINSRKAAQDNQETVPIATKNSAETNTNDSLIDQADAILAKYNTLDGEIPTNSPEYGNYVSQRSNALNDLRSNFSDNDLAFLFTKTDDPKIKALISDSVSSPDVKARLAEFEAQGPDSNNIYKNGTVANDKSYEGMSPSEMLNSKAQDAGFENYDAAVRKFTDTGEAVKGTDIVDWMDAKAMQSPETEVYRTLTGQAEEPMRTSKEYEARQKRNQKLLDQYGTIDKPTAKATRAEETVGKIADAGFEKPQDVEAAIKKITGSDGEVNKLNRKVIANAGQINTWDGAENGTTLDDFIDQQVRINGLFGTSDEKAIKTELAAILNQLPSRKDGTLTGLDAAEDAFDVVQMIEKHSANYKGRSGSNYATSTPYKEQKAAVLDSVASLIKDRIYDASDVKKVVTPDVIADMKSWYPNNEKWARYVDENIASAKSGADLRAAQAPFVRMGKILDNTVVNSGTFGQKLPRTMLRMATSNPLGILVNGIELAGETNLGKRAQAKYYDWKANRAANKAANAGNENPTPAGGSTVPPAQITETAGASQAYNPATQVYNAVGRSEGLSNAEQARTANYVADAVQEAEIVSNNTNGKNATQVYDAITGTTAVAPTISNANNSYFSATGDYWTDILGVAMSRAMDADDAEAFGQLYEMYQSALAGIKENQDTSSVANLSATQQAQLAKLDAADSAIDELEGLFENAGGGKGPIAGNLQSIAGDWGWDTNARTYNQLSEGLVNQIAQAVGKTDSLNTEGEVKRALQLIPQLTDDAQTAKNKLEALRRMLATTKSSYNAAYGITA